MNKFLYVPNRGVPWQSTEKPTDTDIKLWTQGRLKIYGWDDRDDVFVMMDSLDEPIWAIPEDRSPPVFDPVKP